MFGYVTLDLRIWHAAHFLISCRFAVLIGPLNHLKHLFSKERIPFSCAYLASLGLTLYFSLGVGSVPVYIPPAESDLVPIAPFISWVPHLRHRPGMTRIHSLAVLFRVETDVRDAGRGTAFIHSRILPRRHADAAVRRPDGAARCWQPTSLLALLPLCPCIFSIPCSILRFPSFIWVERVRPVFECQRLGSDTHVVPCYR